MIKNLFSSQLRINMVSGVVATVVNIVVLAVAYPVYLHFLGYEKYGVWLILATVLTFAQLGNLGIGQAIMKLVAEEHGRDNMEGIQRYVTTALALLCLSGTVILIVILVLKSQIIAAFKLSEENAKTVSWLLPYIGILSIYVLVVQALNATLSGLGRMDLANYTQSSGRIVAVATTGSLLYRGHGIESLLIGNTLSYVLVHIASLILIWRIAHIRFLRIGNFNAQCCKRLLRFGGGVFGGTLVSMLLSPFNKLMLSRYAGVSTIPVYEIAFAGSMQVRGLIEAGLRALMPEISRISAKMTRDAKNRISHIYRRAMKLIIICGLPLFVVLFAFAHVLLKFWLRKSFVETLPGAFRLMLIVTFLSLLGVPAYYTLLGLGKARCSFISFAIISGGNFAWVMGMILAGRDISVNSIFVGLIFVSGLSALYLVRTASKQIANCGALVNNPKVIDR